ncbi:hypothetical protein NG796_14120 [Laspinema sp. A4]|uniref:hypothetical protein n=1 Tax=Laspinema sp. D2d TaxID=2953686 RepID=UPI0021BA668B|nr:hypothetical protein [Laspinema sp. D2d]MCT7984433.1 hypothetical protein [Laspinema sp. D2d]
MIDDKITVAGKSVPVYYENERGEIVIPSDIERKIVLGFVGRALATPVTAVTIVIGEAWRDIRLTYERVVQDIDVEVSRTKIEAENRKMKDIFEIFGREIAGLECLPPSYPESVKKMYRNELIKKMEKRLQAISNKD